MKYMTIVDDELLSNFKVTLRSNSPFSEKVLVVTDEAGFKRGIVLKPLQRTMTSEDEIIQELERTKDYPANDPASDEALDGAIDIVRKYQKIVQIMERTVDDGTSMYDTLQEIEEVIEDESN